ncbi:hypothetical protein DFH07DRAFT_1012023 [Mycena maculata]|uniref:NmrA-like domain-containing protein n=1 Tax=Mycena maculata TaxID=230809 RepID=A0AAD7NN04_9AGAR|nr:hypothetical protein DFH07DRAFT_1012023 [Mycena maculata]
MTILLTGGTGKSATPLANLLLRANIPVILANRSGIVPAPFKGVRFDWLDASTYGIPFDADGGIERVYLIPPPTLGMLPLMKSFIDVAIGKGVKRFVLMSASMVELGGPMMGQVHEYLRSLGVEYCALRPSWFFDTLRVNFSDTIRERNEIVNAAGAGLIGWISTEDIADVAFKALTAPTIEHTNPVLVGPELLSYAQIAGMMSKVLGREIKHRNVNVEEYSQVLIRRGMPPNYAGLMSTLDLGIAAGAEEQLYRNADFVGKRTLRVFLEEYKDAEEWRAV